MLEAIFAILMHYQPFFADNETEPVRRERMRIVAAAIEHSADRATCSGAWAKRECRRLFNDRRGLAAALIVIGHEETRFARYVHENRCLDGPPGMRCDLDDKGVPRARGLWQVWRVACPDLWDRMVDASLEATKAAAWCSATRIAGAYRRCQNHNRDAWSGAFSGYRGASCTWPGAVRRARRVRQLIARL